MITKVLRVEDGSTLCITVQSPRTITISPLNDRYEILDDNGKLIGLNYNGDLNVKIGDVIKIDKQVYKISYIDKEESPEKGGPAYLLKMQKRISKTSMYIMPFLGYDRTYFRWSIEFTNAFIGTEAQGDYGSTLYLLYRYNGELGFTGLESRLENHPCYEAMIDPDRYQVLYQFKLPEEYKNDIEKILKGKYSTISMKAKARILQFHGSSPERPLGQILNKSEKRREEMERDLKHPIPKDQELLDIFDIMEEMFLNKYIITKENESENISDNSLC